MSDRYGEFVQSGIGRTVAKNLGLPTPIKLDRYQAGQPIVRGEVAFGGTDGVVKTAVLETLAALDAKVTNERDLDKRLADESTLFKVVVFDATQIKDTDGLKAVYEFFHKIARRIKLSGRVIVIARPACCTAEDINFALAQRAVLGFVKSVAKEFKRGITANVLYVESDAEAHLDHALRFFMSAKSAYVSGQPVYITKGQTTLGEFDEQKPLKGKKNIGNRCITRYWTSDC